MTEPNLQFGVLTLATPNDYLKAIGLALSVRVSNPGVPIAVACSAALAPRLAPYFDHVIEERRGLRGFQHKVYLDQYSPFQETFFFDSDVLVFKALHPYAELWGRPAYSAVGDLRTHGISEFGLDRGAVLRRLGRERLVVIDGAGHAFFRKPDCTAVFDHARQVTEDYAQWAGNATYADEDAMSIVMTARDLPPAPYGDFFSRHASAVPGTLVLDAARGMCRFVWRNDGKPFEPCMMHFAANEAPVPYTLALIGLFRAHGVPVRGLLGVGLADLWETRVRWRYGPKVRRVRQLLALG